MRDMNRTPNTSFTRLYFHQKEIVAYSTQAFEQNDGLLVEIMRCQGRVEEFDRDKLERSLIQARVAASDVLEVAEHIATRIKDGTTTGDIRDQVIAALKGRETAKRPRGTRVSSR